MIRVSRFRPTCFARGAFELVDRPYCEQNRRAILGTSCVSGLRNVQKIGTEDVRQCAGKRPNEQKQSHESWVSEHLCRQNVLAIVGISHANRTLQQACGPGRAYSEYVVVAPSTKHQYMSNLEERCLSLDACVPCRGQDYMSETALFTNQ